jgi:hypothetical protein
MSGIYSQDQNQALRGCLISFQQVIFILENMEQGTHRNNKIQSPPLTRGGLGWGQTKEINQYDCEHS